MIVIEIFFFNIGDLIEAEKLNSIALKNLSLEMEHFFYFIVQLILLETSLKKLPIGGGDKKYVEGDIPQTCLGF